jgi:superfamily II DNA or RNA helicase
MDVARMMRIIPAARTGILPLPFGQALADAGADRVRSAIARGLLGDEGEDVQIGDVTLRPHQRDAVARLRHAIEEFGGALLADEVGLGKTFVAIALAREASRAMIVAPAVLRSMWERALARAGCKAAFTSHEMLSRRDPPAGDYDFVVVDEAHHARTPTTLRYRRLAALTANARVLLLSATPVHANAADLTALLGLFLGERASVLDDRLVARCVVRRGRGDAELTNGLPCVEPTRHLTIPVDSCVDALANLPPPVPARDGGHAGALLTYSLVRQWASSQGALVAALRRRLAFATSLIDNFDAGRYPTRAELQAWTFDGSVVQLAFPELVAATVDAARGSPGTRSALGTLRAAVESHCRAISELLRGLHAQADPDLARVQHLRDLLVAHPGARIVAFTEYAETALAFFRLLRLTPGIAALTARGGLVAGGQITRADVLAQFAPRARGAPPLSAATRIGLLVTTDLLSEGVDLHDASVVVHIDLPWTPARLEQRVGRLARMGSVHARIAVYTLDPPATAETLLSIERRLRDKLRNARQLIGVAGAILPSLAAATHDVPPSAPMIAEDVRRLVRPWLAAPYAADADRPCVAAVRAPHAGFLALVSVDGAGAPPILVAKLGDALGAEWPVIRDAARLAEAPPIGVSPDARLSAVASLGDWCRQREGARAAAIDAAPAARARRRISHRIETLVRRTPLHRRAGIAVLAADARRALTAPLGAGAERILAELGSVPHPDEGWLRAVAAFATLHTHRAVASPSAAAGSVRVAGRDARGRPIFGVLPGETDHAIGAVARPSLLALLLLQTNA